MQVSPRTGRTRITISLLAVLVALLAAACSTSGKPTATHAQPATTTNP
jgi:hypothetical protein